MAAKHIDDGMIEAVIERIAGGISLKKSCAISGFEYTKIVKLIKASESLSQLHAQARVDYQAIRVAEMREIAETVEDVQRARLMCDNIKWEAARISPKTYGDKLDLNHSGAIDLGLAQRVEAARKRSQ